jgi:hypothetical protein
MHRRFWSEDLKRREHSKHLSVRWEDNIKMDVIQIGLEGADWIHEVQDIVQWRIIPNTVMNLRVP